MAELIRRLDTRMGEIRFPAYIPVTTFGDKYPLDKLVQPYLPRLAQAVMVSYHYARQMVERPRVPIMVDSGGFASLFERSKVIARDGLGTIEIKGENGIERVSPQDVLDLQERIGEVAFTLDFPIPPGMNEKEAQQRQELTIANAFWALENRRRSDLPLYACVQAWDVESARVGARAYAGKGFDGVAIGGLVPRVKDRKLVMEIVQSVREEVGELPIHVFGLGRPEMAGDLFRAGIDSMDSSSYVQLAAEGKLWSQPGKELKDPSPTDRLHLALCNLAQASGKALPLSMAGLIFTTHALPTNNY